MNNKLLKDIRTYSQNLKLKKIEDIMSILNECVLKIVRTNKNGFSLENWGKTNYYMLKRKKNSRYNETRPIACSCLWKSCGDQSENGHRKNWHRDEYLIFCCRTNCLKYFSTNRIHQSMIYLNDNLKISTTCKPVSFVLYTNFILDMLSRNTHRYQNK